MKVPQIVSVAERDCSKGLRDADREQTGKLRKKQREDRSLKVRCPCDCTSYTPKMYNFHTIVPQNATGLITHHWNFPLISKKEKTITRVLSMQTKKSFGAEERRYAPKLDVV